MSVFELHYGSINQPAKRFAVFFLVRQRVAFQAHADAGGPGFRVRQATKLQVRKPLEARSDLPRLVLFYTESS